MDKKFADDMIAQFQKKFFGFALNKCNDITEAEELAARITCEAYITLRTVENVYNWEGYLHKIASNVYAHYVQEQVKHKSGDISGVDVQSEENFESDLIKKEELELLKREVAWLSKRHREIVLLHYFHNKKLSEIAKELNVSPVFIEDEVEYLEEWGFLDLMPGQKYRTNIFIDCTPYEALLRLRELEAEVAKMICDEYIPELVRRAENYSKEDIFVPGDDLNYFLWSLIPLALTQYSMGKFDWEILERLNYIVRRKDGGKYAALATLYQEKVEEILEKEYLCGPMYVGDSSVPIYSWSVASTLIDRRTGWDDNIKSDYTTFAMFLRNKLPKAEGVLDKYIRLYERGILRQEDDSVNVIVVKEREENGFFDTMRKYESVNLSKIDFAGYLRRYIPEMPKEMLDKISELREKRVQMEKSYYPKHMHEMLRGIRSAREINVFMVIEELIKRGTLKPLTDGQKKGVMVIVYSDIFPDEK